jgi:hypothetical protein
LIPERSSNLFPASAKGSAEVAILNVGRLPTCRFKQRGSRPAFQGTALCSGNNLRSGCWRLKESHLAGVDSMRVQSATQGLAWCLTPLQRFRSATASCPHLHRETWHPAPTSTDGTGVSARLGEQPSTARMVPTTATEKDRRTYAGLNKRWLGWFIWVTTPVVTPWTDKANCSHRKTPLGSDGRPVLYFYIAAYRPRVGQRLSSCWPLILKLQSAQRKVVKGVPA